MSRSIGLTVLLIMLLTINKNRLYKGVDVMDRGKLQEIMDDLSILPGLQERMEKLRRRIYEAEDEVQQLQSKYESESLDVKQLERESFSKIILKFIGKYEGKVDKETQEMLAAKLEYDEACDRVRELYRERNELGSKIADLKRQEKLYEEELKRREKEILSGITNEVSIKYKKLEEERERLLKQLVETEEAIMAANRVQSTIESAMKHLESAESWATYDIWAKSGIISHMAKYSHVDDAQAEFNRLHSQLKDLHKELIDIDIFKSAEFIDIDSTTRAIDFWFDNIFTDLNVRSMIRDNEKKLRNLDRNIDRIIAKLESNKTQINRDINNIEFKKKELIV